MGREIEQRCRRIFTYKLGRCGVCDGISSVLLFLSAFPPKQNLPYDAFGLKDQLLREIKRKKVWEQGGIKREGQQFDNSTMKGHAKSVRDYLCFCIDKYNDSTAKVTQERVTHFVVAYLRHLTVEKGKTQGQVVGGSTIGNCMDGLRWLKVQDITNLYFLPLKHSLTFVLLHSHCSLLPPPAEVPACFSARDLHHGGEAGAGEGVV